jgi:hypothetical protein
VSRRKTLEKTEEVGLTINDLLLPDRGSILIPFLPPLLCLCPPHSDNVERL